VWRLGETRSRKGFGALYRGAGREVCKGCVSAAGDSVVERLASGCQTVSAVLVFGSGP
jgi:hypothetical protein